MPTVLEEVTETEITRHHVEQRVDDWCDRIDALYRQIDNWLPNGYSSLRRRTVPMYEEMMKSFGVPPRNLPVLEISRAQSIVARIEPRGLWIIGVNGRLDVFVGSAQYIIVDLAENFTAAAWVISSFSNRKSRQPLTQQTFCSILPA